MESKTSERLAKNAMRPAETATPDGLRRVAEEVRAAFPRPMRAPELVLIDVDPRHLHAFWTLAAGDVEEARREFGDEGDNAPMVLRIGESDGDDTSSAPFDVEVVGLQGRCYVDIWGEARGYTATLGLRATNGKLRPLAGPATVRLPNIGPADQTFARAPAAGDADIAVSRAAAVSAPPRPDTSERNEPLVHPFPQPPSAPGVYDALTALGEALEAAPAAGVQTAPAPHPGLPEPVSHRFPLPPTEPGEYVPEGLIGGFLPEDTVPVAEERGSPAEAIGDAEPHADPAGQSPPEGEPAPNQPQALPLENVLTLSSYVLGRETVEFEINAELHIFGRVRPGTRLQLFGRPVPLRPDGTFSITRPLPNGALVLSSLLVEGDGETSD